MISEVERNIDPGYLGKYPTENSRVSHNGIRGLLSRIRQYCNGMSCSGSGGKPLTTRRHTDENESLEESPEVQDESAGCTDHEGLGNA